MSAQTREAYGKRIQFIAPDHYRLHWTVDRKYSGSRLRYPTGYRRDTDEQGARRFARRWGVPVPNQHGIDW